MTAKDESEACQGHVSVDTDSNDDDSGENWNYKYGQ